jgi:hypothetical protein
MHSVAGTKWRTWYNYPQRLAFNARIDSMLMPLSFCTTHISQSTRPYLRDLFRLLTLVVTTLAVVHSAQAQNVAPPNAGGYSSDYGSDFGVGAILRTQKREPVAVVSIRGQRSNSTTLPWLGVRFAAMLSEKLTAPMKRTASPTNIMRLLAANGIRSYETRLPPNASSARSNRALAVIRSNATYRAFPLLVVGDVTLQGEMNKPNSKLTIRLRAIRNDKAASAASDIVTLSAPSSEWAQLPARSALALLDNMQIVLIEDERIEFLREASPLQPPSSNNRIQAESALGTAIAAALDSQSLQVQAQRTAAVPQRAVLLRQAATRGNEGQRLLRTVLSRSDAATIQDGTAMTQLVQAARRWRAYVDSVATAARRKAPPQATPKPLP